MTCRTSYAELRQAAGPTKVGLVSLAASTHRADPAATQDAGAISYTADLPILFICDGIGGNPGGGEASRTVVDSILLDIQNDPQCPIRDLFANAQLATGDEFSRWLEGQPAAGKLTITPESAFNTTAIVARELEGSIEVGYLGNGAAIHLRGDFFETPPALMPPFVNLLAPHTSRRTGREVLNKYIGPGSSGSMVEPTIITVGKDYGVGDLLIVTTDGIVSADQQNSGKDPSGNVWLSIPAPLNTLFQGLRELFADPGTITRDDLTARIQAKLDILRAEGVLEDDATVGVIVTGAALTYRTSVLGGEAWGP